MNFSKASAKTSLIFFYNIFFGGERTVGLSYITLDSISERKLDNLESPGFAGLLTGCTSQHIHGKVSQFRKRELLNSQLPDKYNKRSLSLLEISDITSSSVIFVFRMFKYGFTSDYRPNL